jgi:hypothetical protein
MHRASTRKNFLGCLNMIARLYITIGIVKRIAGNLTIAARKEKVIASRHFQISGILDDNTRNVRANNKKRRA